MYECAKCATECDTDDVLCSVCGRFFCDKCSREVIECAECKDMICLACFRNNLPECGCCSEYFTVHKSMIQAQPTK
jgi:hypothetical protein